MVGVIAGKPKARVPINRALGCVVKGVDDFESDEVKAWTPAYENYTLTEVDGCTELAVDIEVPSTYQAFFEEVWPRALKAVKELSEK